jgi:NADH-quinone oxidoreductase subunit K/NAD(P)H-quinone oxidoreductase subunit 4L
MSSGPGLQAYLIVGALLFAIGVVAVLSQRSVVMVLMGVEIMLNATLLTLVAFWRFVAPRVLDAQVFAIVLLTLAAVELAAGLGLVLLIYRQRGTQNLDKLAELKR